MLSKEGDVLSGKEKYYGNLYESGHATYNLLIVYGGAAPYVAYVLPVLLMAVGKLSALRLTRRE